MSMTVLAVAGSRQLKTSRPNKFQGSSATNVIEVTEHNAPCLERSTVIHSTVSGLVPPGTGYDLADGNHRKKLCQQSTPVRDFATWSGSPSRQFHVQDLENKGFFYLFFDI